MPRPAVFLDRDGTLIVEKHYLHDPEAVELEAGAVTALRQLAAAGFLLVGITNQSGIGRGYFTRADADAVHAHIDALLAAHGVALSGWYMCPHAPTDACQCRKPLPGLALQAAREHGIDLARSFVIGDKLSDVDLARAFGGTGLLVTSGHGGVEADAARDRGVPVVAGLIEAAAAIADLAGGTV